MKTEFYNRRHFLKSGAALITGAAFGGLTGLCAETEPSPVRTRRQDATVAIVPCRSYGPEVRTAMSKSFDLLGGIGSLVSKKTVTVKLNLTGTDFSEFLNRPPGETYMSHYSTALALASLLFDAGAKRVRFVESTNSRAALQATLALADWDVKALEALGKVEFENTRNLGLGAKYSHLKVPFGGNMFSSFDLNHAYEETDVMISLAKLKNHVLAGVTLSMKNMFGITPNALYGGQAGDENATEGRGPLHSPWGSARINLPGLKPATQSTDPSWRVPRVTVDVCAARPIHLAIIDGITSMSGGEGPWCGDAAVLKFVSPGVLIAGLNPVSTDTVATAVMGYKDPRASRGTKPFPNGDNHLLLAEQAGLGSANLADIEVRGQPIEKARYPYG